MMIDKYNIFILNELMMFKAGTNNFINRMDECYLIKKRGGDLGLDIKRNGEWTDRNILIDNFDMILDIISNNSDFVCFKGFSDRNMVMFINSLNRLMDTNIDMISFSNNSDAHLYEKYLLDRKKNVKKEVQKLKNCTKRDAVSAIHKVRVLTK